jgi:hypothetical protein
VDELRQFDFWLGEWKLTWEGGEGRNVIKSELDGRVIVERFDGRPAIPLRGISVSVYDVGAGVWRQTWADSNGRYLDFVGGMRDRDMDLRRAGRHEGEPGLFRMLWHEISADSLRWNWEFTTDGGKAWQTVWAIAYERLGWARGREGCPEIR